MHHSEQNEYSSILSKLKLLRSRFCARGANVTTRRARARGWGGHVLTYCMVSSCCDKSWVSNVRDPTIFLLPPTCDDMYHLLWWISLTLVIVFSLFTHCNKYRIYFYIIEGGPGEPPPGTTCYDMYHLLWCISMTLDSVFSLLIYCAKYQILHFIFPNYQSQGWVPTKRTVIFYLFTVFIIFMTNNKTCNAVDYSTVEGPKYQNN